MVEFLIKLLLVARSRLKSRARVEAENMVLRQQLIVLGRKAQARVQLRNTDRLLFVWLYRLFPSMLDAITVVKPETVIRWHRREFRSVLALEIAPPRRPPKDQFREPRTDWADEPRECCVSAQGKDWRARKALIRDDRPLRRRISCGRSAHAILQAIAGRPSKLDHWNGGMEPLGTAA